MTNRRSLKGKLELTWMGKDQALIPTSENTYDYTWVDKNDPRASQTHYLIDEGHVGDPTDGGIHDNLLITGDSGDVLEALTRVPELADNYVGQVKCIYIDPPFNTGHAFTNYEDNLEHSVWLTFMRDRLVLLKRLLAEDGSIWVHLDDSENHRMRVLMDEVLGASNFVAEIIWEKADSGRNDGDGISVDQDVILVYGKHGKSGIGRLPREESANARFTNPDGDLLGPWWDGDPSAEGAGMRNQHAGVYGIQHPITGEMVYPSPGSHWRIGQKNMLEVMRGWGDYGFGEVDEAELARRREICGPRINIVPEIRPLVVTNWGSESVEHAWNVYKHGTWPSIVIRGGGKGGFGKKNYIPTLGSIPRSLWHGWQVGYNRTAKAEIKALFPGTPAFDTPKPERLLERILTIATSPGDLVFDCFAGSGTTAAVAHKMGRRWVTVELLPETIEKFTKPRLEKVINNEDPGGITSTSQRVAADELPEGFTPREAQEFTRLLNKANKVVDYLDPATTKKLRATFKTKNETTTRWNGGGGFDVARLSPIWVGVDVDEVSGERFTYTTAEATGEVLERSVAAHLGFYLTPENPRFAGVKGNQRLAVIEGIVTEEKVEELAEALGEGESVTIVCDGTPEGLSRTLQKRVKGSRVLVMPDDLFTVVKGAR